MKANQTNTDWLNEKVREVMFSQICDKLPNGFSNTGFNDIRIVHYNASNRTHMIFSYNNDPNSLRLVVDISLKNAKLIQKKGFTFEESDSETIYTSLPDTCVQIRQYGSGWTFEVISIINKKSYWFYNKALGINEYPFNICPEIPGYI